MASSVARRPGTGSSNSPPVANPPSAPQSGCVGVTVQTNLDLRPSERVGDALERIRRDASSEAEKGRWFEHLFMATVRDNPEFDVAAIWPWRDWPDREQLTGLDGRDHGIDLVATQMDGTVIAIQCKCYAAEAIIAKPNIDSFLNESSRPAFGLRWIVSTCAWNAAAERAIAGRVPRVARIDFLDFLDQEIRQFQRPAAQRQPKPLQQQAIDAVYDGLVTQGNDRGKLVMACGTGKTFTALRLSERIVPDEGRILFAAPTIALVSQARREWLTHQTRDMSALVVCSDSTAGGRGERQEIGADDLVCDVVSDPADISRRLGNRSGGVKAVFCTYHSLRKVCEAQARYGAPGFDLAIADEAHRTTGVIRDDIAGKEVDFQAFHDAAQLNAGKRLYMTATQRMYTQSSVRATERAAERKGFAYNVVDMSDLDVYGPLLHHVKFSQAVAAGELSDYRVIVLGIRESQLTPGIRAALAGENAPKRASDTDLCRLLGTMLALNGAVEGGEKPSALPRSIAFASTIQRSKWFRDTINGNLALKQRVTRTLAGRGKRADLEARHLDGKSTALQRNQERRWLNDAPHKSQARMICNVKVFSEGVDVPALDAVAFLDPKQSQIDIVQAVGRVMRKAKGKRFGYIVVPVFVPEGEGDIAELLQQRGDDYRHIGAVLRALQSHDERLAESPATFVHVLIDTGTANGNQRAPTARARDGEVRDDDTTYPAIGDILAFQAVEPGIFAKVVAASGLGRPGQVTADDIVRSVGLAARRIEDSPALMASLRQALDLTSVKDREVSTTAALLLCNACLLHRRLQKESAALEGLPDLIEIGRSHTPAESLAEAWDAILGKDYAPVFRPALSLIENSPSFDGLKAPARILAECAVNLSDAVTELGYDHAGPLYHKILGSAVSDGAFYTNNISALMLAGLALGPNFADWSDWQQATGLRILDPACGTGTLLMAALKTIKDHMAAAKPMTPAEMRQAHKALVEQSIRGLDINYQATQLAASNLTLGAPTVDYEAMHIHTMRHGPQPDGSVALGSLELLPTAVGGGEQLSLLGHVKQAAVSTRESAVANVPNIRGMDVILMNPPFTNNEHYGRRFSAAAKKGIQQRKLEIKRQIHGADPAASHLIDSNSVRTLFTPLADALLHKNAGVLGKILPTTACTSTSGVDERRFLAERFHIDFIVTSHDPKRPNFSVNTAIHESLLICRRRGADEPRRATTFIALTRIPQTAQEAADWVAAVHAGENHRLHRAYVWPAERMAAGDWTPCQYLDGTMAALARYIDEHDATTPLGDLALVEPGGRRLRDAFVNPLDHPIPDAKFPVVWTHETNNRRAMSSFADFTTEPKPAKRQYATDVLWPKASRMLVAAKIRASRVRVSAIHTPRPALGQPFIPVTPLPHISAPAETLEAWCAYLNSTAAVASFLNRRQKALDYSDYSLEQLRSLPVPDPAKCDLTPLQDAFHRLGKAELLPWPQMDECPVRTELDAAAAACLGRDPEAIAYWREKIVREPTVSNRPAYTEGIEDDDFIAHLMNGPSFEGLDLERDRSPMRDIEL